MKKKVLLIVLMVLSASLVATLSACAPKTPFKVVFDYGYDSLVETENYADASIIQPKTPTAREGYRFLGWYNGETLFDFSIKYNVNLNLTAKWIRQFNVKITSDGQTVKELIIDKDTSISSTDLALTKEGFTLSGFFTEDGGTLNAFPANTKITKDVEIIADWASNGMIYSFNEIGQFYCLSRYSGIADNVKIPAFYMDKPVSQIGDDTSDSGGITGAFFNTKATSITFSQQKVNINTSAFKNANISSITVDKNILTIGSTAFQNCTNLTSVIFDNSVITTLKGGVFSGCTKLVRLDVPSSVTDIEYGVIMPSGIKTISFKNSVLRIADSAFLNTSNADLILSDDKSSYNKTEWGASWSKNGDNNLPIYYGGKVVNLNYNGGLCNSHLGENNVIVCVSGANNAKLYVPQLSGKTFEGYALADENFSPITVNDAIIMVTTASGYFNQNSNLVIDGCNLVAIYK